MVKCLVFYGEFKMVAAASTSGFMDKESKRMKGPSREGKTGWRACRVTTKRRQVLGEDALKRW